MDIGTCGRALCALIIVTHTTWAVIYQGDLHQVAPTSVTLALKDVNPRDPSVSSAGGGTTVNVTDSAFSTDSPAVTRTGPDGTVVVTR